MAEIFPLILTSSLKSPWSYCYLWIDSLSFCVPQPFLSASIIVVAINIWLQSIKHSFETFGIIWWLALEEWQLPEVWEYGVFWVVSASIYFQGTPHSLVLGVLKLTMSNTCDACRKHPLEAFPWILECSVWGILKMLLLLLFANSILSFVNFLSICWKFIWPYLKIKMIKWLF